MDQQTQESSQEQVTASENISPIKKKKKKKGLIIFLVVLLIEFGIGLADLQRGIEANGVGHFERAHRHAALAADIFDDRRGDAFHQHLNTFGRIGAVATRGVEAAAVVHDDRRLADLLHEVHRPRQGLGRGLLADDDLDQRHLLDRREEVDADEVLRAR